MIKQPSCQPDGDPTSWFDDPNISNDDTLARGVRSADQLIKLPNGTFGISAQLWTSTGGGCSAELQSLIRAANETLQSRATANGDVGTCTVVVAEVRACMNRRDEATKKEYEQLGVAHTPLSPEEPHGPNPYHCEIFPVVAKGEKMKIGKPGSKNLGDKAKLIFLDQARAAALWAEKHGLG